MTPPQALRSGQSADGDKPAAASLRVTTLTKRGDFQRAARASRISKPGFILQMRVRQPDEAEGPRVGFTCSKKVGNAVARNRAKRRLREIARRTLGRRGMAGADYVLIGRQTATATLPFAQLLSDLEHALDSLHKRLK
jgi:ribonuclease P protein component